MYKMKRLALPALFLTLGVWACSDAGLPERQLLGPDRASFSDGTVTETKFKVVKGHCLSGTTKINEKVIQPYAGGNVGIGGNDIAIPKNAIDKPTLFRMEAKAVGCSGQADLQVALTAWHQDSKGEWKISVGHLGFLKPLRLKLNVENLAESVDLNNLRIIWIRKDGTQEVYSTELYGGSGKYVSTDVEHFSDYAVAQPY